MIQSDWDDLVNERISIILMNGVSDWEAEKIAFKDTVSRFGPRPVDCDVPKGAVSPGSRTTGGLKWYGPYKTTSPGNTDGLKR